MDTAKANKINSRRTAVWGITPNGIRLGRRLCSHFQEYTLFIPEKEAAGPTDISGDGDDIRATSFSRLGEELPRQFRKFDAHIFIFATGIAVRLIAPLIKTKLEDPAVVVVDEKGFHAVSLLSGHIGGANDLARYIGEVADAVPVITTATDINTLPSIDMIARDNGLYIENPGAIKYVNMAFLKGKKIRIYDPLGLVSRFIPDGLAIPGTGKEPDIDLACTWEQIKVPRETLVLRPRVLSVGIGCNRNTPEQNISDFLTETFKAFKLSPEAISTLATTTVKADEQGLLALGRTLNLPIQFYERDQLNSVESIENPSEMAEKYLGVKSVCEAAAILSARMGKLIVPKQKTRDVTLAVAVPK